MGATLVVPARRTRALRTLAVAVPASLLGIWLAAQPVAAEAGWRGWWQLVFPALALHALYRLRRPRTPLVLGEDGVHVDVGLPVIGLRTTIPWAAVDRFRLTVADVLKLQLRDPDGYAATQPWLVRANIRATRRRSGAAVAIPLRELQPPPGGLEAALRQAARVPVEGWRERGVPASRGGV